MEVKRYCIICKNEIPKDRQKNAKTCSHRCSRKYLYSFSKHPIKEIDLQKKQKQLELDKQKRQEEKKSKLQEKQKQLELDKQKKQEEEFNPIREKKSEALKKQLSEFLSTLPKKKKALKWDKEHRVEYMRDYKKKRREKHLCVECGKPVEKFTRCNDCQKKFNLQKRIRYYQHKETLSLNRIYIDLSNQEEGRVML